MSAEHLIERAATAWLAAIKLAALAIVVAGSVRW